METLPPQLDEAITAGPPLPPPKRKGWVWTSWAIIVIGMVCIFGVHQLQAQSAIESHEEPKPSWMIEIQARMLVGTYRLFGPAAGDVKEQLKQLNNGDIIQRLCGVVIAGEVAGPKEALKQLDDFDKLVHENNVRLTDSQRRIRSILGGLYSDYDAGRFQGPSADAQQRTFLFEKLDWFGDLALHPATPIGQEVHGRADAIRPAITTAITLLCVAFLVLTLSVTAPIGALAFIILAYMGVISWRIRPGIAHGGVYAETFAIWLWIFFGVGFVNSMLPVPRLMQMLLTFPMSLIALGWPLLRGVPWAQLRQDIGLICERNPFVEIAAGITCYIINLPLVLLGLGITFALLLLQGIGGAPAEGGGAPDFTPQPLPSHPIVQILADADVIGVLQIFLLASVFAPLVEEIMFRGVLHRHCRELTGRWWPFFSALASTAIVSFIFAAVHPQGLAVIPPLMFMAYGFSLAREWRGSLLPSMFAHGLSNGLVLTVAMLALSR